jgi:DNA-binding PadR family transcriptional regulator
MASKPDQRTRGDLDLFLLALISQEVATPYQMQVMARISQGASLQSLKRLAARKLIRAKEEGPRRRTQFVLTRAGTNWLKQNCAVLSQTKPSGDAESILRRALLIAFIENDRKSASAFLKTAAATRRLPKQSLPGGAAEVPEMVRRYARLRRALAVAIAQVEAEIFEAAAADLKYLSKRD